jgi:soluble lytic murein transglycosylase-like protein
MSLAPQAATASVPYEHCFTAAAAHYQVPKSILMAIAKHESRFNPRAVNQNNDRSRTRDLGLMQINTQHLPKLRKHGIEEQHLFDPCTNVMVGAWLLRDAIDRKGPTWEAVGVYHSPTRRLQEIYVSKVYRAWQQLSHR